jgi:iron(III) transport system substrate-binding protein
VFIRESVTYILGMPKFVSLRKLAQSALQIALLAAIIAACSPSASAFVMVSAQHEQTVVSMLRAFRGAGYAPPSVVYTEDAELVARVESSGARAGTVIFAENAVSVSALISRGKLAPLPTALKQRARELFERLFPGGAVDQFASYLMPYSARVQVLQYNPQHASPEDLPQHVLDLADPKYRGKVGIAPSEPDFVPEVAAVVQAYGARRALQWLEGLRDNAQGHLFPDYESLALAVEKGTVGMALINHYYWWRLRAESGSVVSRITQFSPGDPGNAISVSGLALVRGAPRSRDGLRLLAFATSPAGQEALVESSSFEYPVLPSVPDAPISPLFLKAPYQGPLPSLSLIDEVGRLLRQAGLV